MKEMNWTRDEALKRLAILLQSAEEDMKKMAVSAVGMVDDDDAAEMLREGRKRKMVAVGIIGAAAALGISMEELKELEVDQDEVNQFLKELNDKSAEKLDEIENNAKGRVKVVSVDEMPDELKDILKSILD